ncbi:MAG: SPOR domain-containing protein [Bacteroidales bacterium]
MMVNYMHAIVLIVVSGWLVYPEDVHSQDPAGTVVTRQIQDTLPYDSLATDSLTIDDFSEEHPLQWENVKQDARITYLLRAHREAVDRQLGVPGYRIHLHMDSGNRARLNTQKEQAEFEEEYPDTPSYIVYEEPYFKLRAGDFRTRLDARRFLEKIRDDYSSAYIVVDLINFPQMD